MPAHDNESNKIEEEFEISIPLNNFSYSNTISDVKESKIPCFFSKVDNKKASRFFGRTREKAKLLDRLQNANKDSRGSFLVAGYRGVGKTRFVDEVLGDYKKDNCDVIEVRINLGSDSELSSKSVLFNMVSLLANEIDKKIFPNITRLFLLPGSSLLGSLLPVTVFSLLLAGILRELYT